MIIATSDPIEDGRDGSLAVAQILKLPLLRMKLIKQLVQLKSMAGQTTIMN